MPHPSEVYIHVQVMKLIFWTTKKAALRMDIPPKHHPLLSINPLPLP
jgi:hypothetical protein